MKNFIAISIASLVLLSNLGISLSSHLCGGKKVETGITIGGKSFACGMAEMEEIDVIPKIPNTISPLPCCSDIQTLFDVEDRYQTKEKVAFAKVQLQAIPFFNTPTVSYKQPNINPNYREYGPPKIFKNYQIAFQVFRI